MIHRGCLELLHSHLVVVSQQAVQEVECLWRHQVRIVWRDKLGPGLAAVVTHQRLQLRQQQQ
jgi:hypothetical protein